MNSEWFLFKGTHHIGPFTTAEVEAMYKSGDINKSVLIWKEGELRWEPLFKVVHFKNLVEVVSPPELPPELPPDLPVNSEIINESVPRKLPAPLTKNLNDSDKDKTNPSFKINMVNSDEIPPPIPMDVFSNKNEPASDVSKDQEQFPEIPERIVGVPSTDYSKWALIAIGISFITVIFWQMSLSNKNDVHFKIRNLMPVYIEKLETNATQLSHPEKLAMALAMDGKTIYSSIASSGEIDISIKLVSVPNRILGKTEGVIYLRGKMLDHLGEFNKVYLTSGEAFSPGEYNYEAHLVEKHFINSYFPAVSSMALFKKLNHKYTIKGTELIYASSPLEFELKINKYNVDQEQLKTKPIQEKLERLNTLMALLEQMNNRFYETLRNSRSGHDIKSFEAFYMRQISPVLQSLVVADNQNPNFEFNGLIKEISGSVLDMLGKTTSMKKIKKVDRDRIEASTKVIEKNIKAHIEQNIKKVEAELAQFKLQK